jgi:hypothetical protein
MQGRSTKRQKEMARQQRQRDKETKKEERQREKQLRPARQPGEEDPDIAGIIPGPQPPLEM